MEQAESNNTVNANEMSLQEGLLQERFFSYIFHELRTPLTVMHSYAQILQTKLPPTPEFNVQRRVTENIVTQGDEMVEMIEELLEAIRIPLGRLNLDFIEYDLVDVVAGLLERLPTNDQERVTWQPPGQNVPVLAESQRLERAIQAVLEYALQTNEQVVIEMERDEEQNEVTLAFPLPFMKLSLEEAQTLFDLYRAVRHAQPLAANLKAGKLDISLYVARGLLQGHRGSLVYDLALPGFIIKLPLGAGHRPSAEQS